MSRRYHLLATAWTGQMGRASLAAPHLQPAASAWEDELGMLLVDGQDRCADCRISRRRDRRGRRRLDQQAGRSTTPFAATGESGGTVGSATSAPSIGQVGICFSFSDFLRYPMPNIANRALWILPTHLAFFLFLVQVKYRPPDRIRQVRSRATCSPQQRRHSARLPSGSVRPCPVFLSGPKSHALRASELQRPGFLV